MKKTTILILLLPLLLPIAGSAQSDGQNYNDMPCGTVITPQQLAYMESTERQRQSYRSNDKAPIYIPVQNHVVRRTNGTGGLSVLDLSHIMLTINHYYNTSDIYFYECGPTNYINDDTYYDFSSSQEGALGSANDVNDVINIYYFNSAMSGSNPVCGYSRFPPSADRVIMDNDCALNGSTIVHELGHYFTLYHTHGKTNTGTTKELVNGSNCTFEGDNVCDTPADPNLSGKVSSSCGYTGTGTDANGQAYAPDVSNIMSYSRKACRQTFTPGQYDRVVASIQFDRNYLTCTPTAPNTDFIANTENSCQGMVAFTDLSSSLPSNWNWDFGDGNTSTARNPIHFYKTNGTYTVRLTTSNVSGADSETKTSYITIDLPTEPNVAIADSVCKNEAASLSATAGGTVYWYASDTATSPIGSGSPFMTAPVTESTTFYAANHIPNAVQNAGPASNTFGGGGNISGNQHLIFDALKPFQLQSVTVYSSAAQTRTFELRNFLGLVLQEITLMVGSGQQTVPLNFNVPAGQDMELGISPTSASDFYRNNGGTSYPYTVPGLLNIKNSSSGGGFYYYFYNWKVKEADCVSPRVPVAVNLKNCTVGMEESNLSSLKLYPNPNQGIFSIYHENSTPLRIEISNLVGKVIYEQRINAGSNEINIANQPAGVYYVKMIDNHKMVTKKIVIH